MFDQFIVELNNIDVGIPLIGSLAAGALIGWEREVQRKAAGLRTHTLVCFASALLTLLGLRMDEWHADLPATTQIVSDLARMPHAVITGIGFLGAGVIFKDGFSVQGLTTAATLWLTAAIGVVFGTGLIGLAILATSIALVVLVVLRFLSNTWVGSEVAKLEITVDFDSIFSKEDLAAILAEHRLKSRLISLESDRQAGVRSYHLSILSMRGPVPTEALAKQLLAHKDLRSLAISD